MTPDRLRECLGLAVGAMIRAAWVARRWEEARCGYPMTEAQERRGNKRMGRLANLARDALVMAAGVERAVRVEGDDGVCDAVVVGDRTIALSFGGDPRGCCGSLVVSDMPGDGWGEGYAIHD